MLPLAIALKLALAAPAQPGLALAPPSLAPPPAALAPRIPSLAPRLDPGPFRAGELALASVGAGAGDVLVLGGAYLALTLFSNGTLQPTASNFRAAAYGLGVAALVVPPLTAVTLAWLVSRAPLAGAFWKALLLATAGEALALATGYYGAPHFWLVLPVQLVTLSLGTSLGLHWGPQPTPAPGGAPAPLVRAPADAGAPRAASLAAPICPDA